MKRSGLSQQGAFAGSVLVLLASQPSDAGGLLERLRELMPVWEASPPSLEGELRRLHDEGLLVPVWEESGPGGPFRQVYEVTNAGREALDRWATDTRRLVVLFDGYLSTRS